MWVEFRRNDLGRNLSRDRVVGCLVGCNVKDGRQSGQLRVRVKGKWK